MKKPTKAEQEVVRLRGLITARDILIGELRTHTCLPPEVKEVHVKGDTVYRWSATAFMAWALGAAIIEGWLFLNHPRIVEKPYYVTVTKAPSDYEETKSVLAECRDDWRMDQLRIKVLEAWKREHEINN